MNNFHYQQVASPRKNILQQELELIQKDIEEKKNMLEKRKLEAEFYEDGRNNNQNLALADEIMNDLIQARPPINKPLNGGQEPPRINVNVAAQRDNWMKGNYSNQQQSDRAQYPSQQRSLSKEHESPQNYNYGPQQPKYQPLQHSPPRQARPQPQHLPPDVREIEKQKLIEKNQNQVFMIGEANSRPRHHQVSPQPNPVVAEQERAISPYARGQKARSPVAHQLASNPFIQQEDAIHQKREEQKKQYFEALEVQREEEKRRKQQEKLKIKEEKFAFNNYQPDQVEPRPSQKQESLPKKKRFDPNGSPPKYDYEKTLPNQSQISSTDKMYITGKLDDLKKLYKRRTIDHEEFLISIKKIEDYYKCQISQIIDDPEINKLKRDAQRGSHSEIKEEPQIKPIQLHNDSFRPVEPVMEPEVQQSKVSAENPSHHPQKHVEVSPAFVASSYEPPHPQHYYPQHQNQQADPNFLINKMYYELKEVKEMFLTNMMNQKQNQMQKMYLQTQNFMQNTMQQIKQQNPQQSDLYKQTVSDGKKPVRREQLAPDNSNSLDNLGMDASSLDMQQSLSGLHQKIPIRNQKKQPNQHQPGQNRSIQPSEIDNSSEGVKEFYDKQYKVKKLKKFSYLATENQSDIRIPSLSTFLSLTHGDLEVENIFNDDLKEMKKIQREKEVIELRQKVRKNYQKDSPKKSKEVDKKEEKKVNQRPKSQDEDKFTSPSPFLKKVSSDAHQIPAIQDQEWGGNYSPHIPEEIYQQEEYQTEPRKKYDDESGRKGPDMMNLLKQNNQFLKKYEERNSPSSSEGVHSSVSKDYFSGSGISPVKVANENYESSMETVKSEEESVRIRKAPSPKASILKAREASIQISRTIESVDESTDRLARPPKKKSTSKKKESSISKANFNPSALVDCTPNRALIKPPEFKEESVDKLEEAHFDSHIYESMEEKSLEGRQYLKEYINGRASSEDDPVKESLRESSLPKEEENQKYQIDQKIDSSQNPSEPKQLLSAGGISNKWKSLQQARNRAKQCKQKSEEDNINRSLAEQKMSELESFLACKEKSLGPSTVKKDGRKKEKKNILNLLDELDNDQEPEDYNEDFHSYKEESER